MDLQDDRELVDRWIATWLRIRDITATTVDGHPLVRVASTTRETELVCVDPGLDELASLMHRIAGDPRAMLTVVAADVGPYLLAPLPAGVRIDRDDESLMSKTLVGVAIPRLDDEFTVRWAVDGARITYTVESGNSVAAEGSVGVLGTTATFDAVETMPAFQRRGLGRHVMAALTEQATGRGATHGVLAASAQGRQLYSSLGWRTRLEMLSFMGA